MAETLLNPQESNQQDAKLSPAADLQRQNKQLKKVIGISLSVVMVGMTIYVLNLQHQNYNILSKSTAIALTASDHATTNYRTYVGRYKETKQELEETTRKLEEVNHQLDQVTAELATTKGMLSQTQGMLVSAQEENSKLKQELQGLDGGTHAISPENAQDINALQDKIKALKDNNTEVSAQLSDLKTQLRAFEGQFSNMKEGRSLITMFQQKIRLVKGRMNELGEQAFLARVAAQKEKDRLAALNGNNGFVVRDGHAQNPDGTKKSFAIDVKIVQ